MKKEDKRTDEGPKIVGSKNSSLAGSKGERENLKKSCENDDDPKLQEFLQVMQPRVKSKLWANDTLITSTADQNGDVSKRKTQEKEERKKKSVPVHIELDESDISDISDNNEAEKSPSLGHDEVISDMDYFKSRVKQKWSDSESSDDEHNNDDKEDEDEGLESQDTHEVDDEEEGPSQDPDGKIPKSCHPSSSLKDDKDEVLETGRLFVRNLPYTAMYSSLLPLFFPFAFVFPVQSIQYKFGFTSRKEKYMFSTVYEISFSIVANIYL